MKIAFLYPRWTGDYGVFGHFSRRSATWPPLNLALLAAIIEQHGHEAIIIDGEVEGFNEDKMVAKALELNADMFGLTCYSPFFHLNTSLAQRLKDAGSKVPILVGGPHITIMKEKVLLPQFDYLFIGEAEKSLILFLDAYQNGNDLSQIEGIIFRKGSEICIGKAQWVEQTVQIKGSTLKQEYALDKYPYPARYLLPMKKYRLGTINGRSHFTSIQTMRGCPWKCIFCASDKLNTTRVVTRSPRSIVDEMKATLRDFPYITHFFIVDDVLTLWDEHILEICDLIIAEGLKITFEGSTRANLVTEKNISRMAQAGLVRLSFGLETVDSEMRKTMKKKVPLEAYAEANKICNKYGVEALNSVMIGLPGETRETVKTTLDWLKNAREVTQANFAIAVPYPGTEFNDMAVAGDHGVQLESEDFSEYLRYGKAVTTVGDLTPQDLIELQNEGFVSIYSAPWRWGPFYRKHGVFGFGLLMMRLFKVWWRKLFKRSKPLMLHPKDS